MSRIHVHGGLRIKLDNGDCGFIRFTGNNVKVQREHDHTLNYPLNRRTVRNVIRTFRHVTEVKAMRERDPESGELKPALPTVAEGRVYREFTNLTDFRQYLRKLMPKLRK